MSGQCLIKNRINELDSCCCGSSNVDRSKSFLKSRFLLNGVSVNVALEITAASVLTPLSLLCNRFTP